MGGLVADVDGVQVGVVNGVARVAGSVAGLGDGQDIKRRHTMVFGCLGGD